MESKVRIIVTGANKLFCQGITLSLSQMGYTVFQIINWDMPSFNLQESDTPDIILVATIARDRNEPKTVSLVQNRYPGVPVVVFIMDEDIKDIINGIKMGVQGYLQASIEPKQLKEAITAITSNKAYYFDLSGEKLIYSHSHDIKDPFRMMAAQRLTEVQKKILNCFCSELSYEEIAFSLQLSPRTLAAYRASICEALHFKSRVGLVLFALKNNLFDDYASIP